MSRINESAIDCVPQEIVEATLRAAGARDVPPADVTLRDIAQEAGMSRSTLLRRLGGSRRSLDEALRAAGVDLGGRKPVKERAIAAAGALISEQGLGKVTFERVAAAAECSVPSLYVTFGGRDELLRAVFDRYSPIVDVEAFLAGPHGDLEATVHQLYRLLGDAMEREPRVLRLCWPRSSLALGTQASSSPSRTSPPDAGRARAVACRGSGRWANPRSPPPSADPADGQPTSPALPVASRYGSGRR